MIENNNQCSPNAIDTVRVGLVTKAVGLRGETSVKPLTDDVTRFRALKHVWFDAGDGVPSYKANIDGVRFHKAQVILKFRDVNNADTARSLCGKYISVTKDMLVSLKPGSYFVFDLIGCRVISTSGSDIGVLYDVLETGSNDVYVVKTGSGDKSDDILLPAIKTVIREVDVTGKRIVADLSMFT